MLIVYILCMPVERKKSTNVKKSTTKKQSRQPTQQPTRKKTPKPKNELNIGPEQPVVGQAEGVLHLIDCMCILPQYMKNEKPTFHKFKVFSEIDENNEVKRKLVQCPNCGIVHKVLDICKSEVMNGKDETMSVLTKDDLRFMLPTRMYEILDGYKCDIATWEYAKFVIDNKRWGTTIVLTNETNDDDKTRTGKAVIIRGTNEYEIQQFSCQYELDVT